MVPTNSRKPTVPNDLQIISFKTLKLSRVQRAILQSPGICQQLANLPGAPELQSNSGADPAQDAIRKDWILCLESWHAPIRSISDLSCARYLSENSGCRKTLYSDKTVEVQARYYSFDFLTVPFKMGLVKVG